VDKFIYFNSMFDYTVTFFNFLWHKFLSKHYLYCGGIQIYQTFVFNLLHKTCMYILITSNAQTELLEQRSHWCVN
jgi:putative component of membrane protein insertase Oxa1/YidC/SpoIIIJ protein YidD